MSDTLVTHSDVGPPWSGVSCDTVVEMIDGGCRGEPAAPAMIFEDGVVVTRQQFLERAESFAGYLAGRTTPGERVAVMLGTRAESMIAFAAVLAACCVLVPIDPSAKLHDAGHILRDSGSVIIVAAKSTAALIASLQPQCPSLREVVMASPAEPDGLAAFAGTAGPLRFAASRAQRRDIATIYYTSGTTGAPKGCMLDHDWWLRLCDVHIRMAGARPGDRPLCCVPFYYADSAFQLLCTVHTGGTLVVMRRFSVSRFWTVVRDSRATELYLVGSMAILLLKQPPSPLERRHGLRVALCLALPASIHRQLVDRFGVPFLDTYGTTEAGWNARMPRAQAKSMIGSGSMGAAVPEIALRVVDERDRDVAVGEAGELLVRGPGLFVGYLNQPDVTAEAMRGGWYRSGDLVRADERGFFYFLGRRKDIIRRAGENIAASEVEDVLRTHPKIRDAAVIAVPDEIRGEEVKAYVLLAEGAAIEALPPEEIVAYCAERLASFKVPRYVAYRTADFPRTPTMRVRKGELKQKADLTRDAWDRERGGWSRSPARDGRS